MPEIGFGTWSVNGISPEGFKNPNNRVFSIILMIFGPYDPIWTLREKAGASEESCRECLSSRY